MRIKLFVGLKVPDTTAITAFHALQRLGYKLSKLERRDYYEFEVLKDEDKFIKEIVGVDILVNANKHTAEIRKADDEPAGDDYTRVLVESLEKDLSLFSTLRERMGFEHLSSVSKGVLWIMDTDKKTSEKIAKDLLVNEHYQKYTVF